MKDKFFVVIQFVTLEMKRFNEKILWKDLYRKKKNLIRATGSKM